MIVLNLWILLIQAVPQKATGVVNQFNHLSITLTFDKKIMCLDFVINKAFHRVLMVFK
jgi:hypothetical protein